MFIFKKPRESLFTCLFIFYWIYPYMALAAVVLFLSLIEKPVLRIRDVCTGSQIRIFPSRIPEPGSKDPESRIRISIKEFKYF
jgi:hypothetical protein